MKSAEIRFFSYDEADALGYPTNCTSCSYLSPVTGDCSHPGIRGGYEKAGTGCAGGVYLRVPPSPAAPVADTAGTQAPVSKNPTSGEGIHMSTTEIKFFTYAEARASGRLPSNTTPCAQCALGKSADDCRPCTDGLYLEVPDGPRPAKPAPEAAGTQAPPAQLSAPQALENAAQHLRDRGTTYDSPDGERSMGRAVAALNALLGRQALSESEGWLLLQLLKDARDRTGKPHRDSLEDGIAYAALKAEARLKEQA